jgi:hypothetical protein
MRSLSFAQLATAVPLALSGCVLPVAGDGAFTVKGKVLSNTAPLICEVQLTDAGRNKALETKQVKGAFSVTFIVAPSARIYDVLTVCDGAVRQTVRVRYGTQVGPGGSVALPDLAI